VLGLKYPLFAIRAEMTAIYATISTGLEPFKTNTFCGTDQVGAQYLELYVVET